MNKIEKFLYIAAEIVYVVCITLATMYFNNPNLMWWYLLVLFLRAYRGH